jgi:hypothetical protein
VPHRLDLGLGRVGRTDGSGDGDVVSDVSALAVSVSKREDELVKRLGGPQSDNEEDWL